MRIIGVHLAVSIWLLGGAVNAADWQALTTELIAKEKPGYGGVSGVVVDHTNGHVYLCLSDRGIFRSTDQGKTWERFGKGAFKGRTEWPGCMLLDPTGKTHLLLIALVYGAPITLGDGGEWQTLAKDSAHVDYAAVDWSDPHRNFVLTLKHESDGKLLVSQDGGKTFREAGNGFGAAWVFDEKTAVIAEIKAKGVAGGHLLRTTDGGKTFQSVGNYEIKSVPKWHDGALYWLMSGALYRTTDKGAKWEKLGDVKDARYGPLFGKDAKQLFVLTGAGVVESLDGGKTWSQPLAPPKELKGISSLTWLEYDPASDTLYLMKMGSELYKMSRR
jgi:BNR/Asp-box repeat